MPPILLVPENVKAWKPIIPHVPAPPPSQLNPDLHRYYKEKEKWKDSTPLYRHTNPRPETWIPKAIVDTNYKIPTAEEIRKERQEYLAIVEEIKDRIPPEYYERWHEYYSRPVRLDGGPDKTGGIDGYYPNMMTHPRFMQKDHTNYNALPREKMFPENELLYKMQEVHQVKENLDIPEDNGVDYPERKWARQRMEQEKAIEEEKKMREEVMRGTHWIDWDSVNEELIDESNQPEDDAPIWSSTLANGVHQNKQWAANRGLPYPISDPFNGAAAKTETRAKSVISAKDTMSSLATNALGLAFGGIAFGSVYGLWKLFTALQAKQIEDIDKRIKPTVAGDERPDKIKRSARAWKEEISLSYLV